MLLKALIVSAVLMNNGEMHILTTEVNLDKCPAPEIVQREADKAFAKIFNVLKVKSICLDPSTSA